jgi:hypothetical protein
MAAEDKTKAETTRKETPTHVGKTIKTAHVPETPDPFKAETYAHRKVGPPAGSRKPKTPTLKGENHTAASSSPLPMSKRASRKARRKAAQAHAKRPKSDVSVAKCLSGAQGAHEERAQEDPARATRGRLASNEEWLNDPNTFPKCPGCGLPNICAVCSKPTLCGLCLESSCGEDQGYSCGCTEWDPNTLVPQPPPGQYLAEWRKCTDCGISGRHYNGAWGYETNGDVLVCIQPPCRKYWPRIDLDEYDVDGNDACWVNCSDT